MAERKQVPIEDAPAIFFDFAPRYYNGMWSTMYRISCGTMYYDDLDHVQDQLHEAEKHDPGYDEEWSETLIRVQDELDSLKQK